MTNTGMDEFKSLTNASVERCIQCGKCSATCPASGDMDMSPHRIVASLRTGDWSSVYENKSVWKCLVCLGCNERCPKDVKPGAALDTIRQLNLRNKDFVYVSVEDYQAMEKQGVPQQLLVSVFRKHI